MSTSTSTPAPQESGLADTPDEIEVDRLRTEIELLREQDARLEQEKQRLSASVVTACRDWRKRASSNNAIVVAPIMTPPTGTRALPLDAHVPLDVEQFVTRAEHNRVVAELEAKVAAVTSALDQIKDEIRRLRVGGDPAPATTLTAALDDVTALRQQEELAQVQAVISAETHADECSYYFVSAAYICESSAVALPSFSTLQKCGALIRRTLRAGVVYRGGDGGDLLAVSHRWDAQHAPDESGAQMRAIQAHLRAHPEITAVWYECVAATRTPHTPDVALIGRCLLESRLDSFSSMPQDDRTPEERRKKQRPDTRTPAQLAHFRHMLNHVNLIFMACSVLILLDLSYLSRFWTQVSAQIRS